MNLIGKLMEDMPSSKNKMGEEEGIKQSIKSGRVNGLGKILYLLATIKDLLKVHGQEVIKIT